MLVIPRPGPDWREPEWEQGYVKSFLVLVTLPFRKRANKQTNKQMKNKPNEQNITLTHRLYTQYTCLHVCTFGVFWV